MFSSQLRNLVSLRARNISKRIKQALEELSEHIENNLANHPSKSPVPVPVRVPVPSRRFNKNNFGAHGCRSKRFLHLLSSVLDHFTKIPKQKFINVGSSLQKRSYSNYSNILSSKYKIGWFKFINQTSKNTLIYKNFQSSYQLWYRFKFYKAPTVISVLRQSLGVDSLSNKRLKLNHSKFYEDSKLDQPKSNLLLNLSLSPKFHDTILNLSKNSNIEDDISVTEHEIIKSCYLDFSINPKLLIPSSTILNEDILNEMIENVKTFEKTLIEIKTDLIKLSELGELPLKYLSNQNIIRIYFPNCDKNKLQSLLLEKDIHHGTIYEEEDAFDNLSSSSSSPPTIPISEFDILSNFNLSDNLQSSINDEDHDLISTSEEDQRLNSSSIKQIETESINQVRTNSNNIQINSYDDFYWA
ncbi:hypothetical protein HYPBUDRAFT_149844 [Hyphopichia burtonii NRRL Y-1933]|uniref:Uncharacterized protein n=1 Tax=Hyphopichia burtonii NRRL Y-1933 TaxID=984485 RepID=A0A1E4RFN2_9ASCO|nr:hypothetical protein HYPBUDRAFT_149844 [Hyphopichia burtonii NRRL Y-1933]ODV66067.1 hypothetical protein HYPBUDRAFT_149844 [Hyphopichia burtonii NRRL Y-1933]